MGRADADTSVGRAHKQVVNHLARNWRGGIDKTAFRFHSCIDPGERGEGVGLHTCPMRVLLLLLQGLMWREVMEFREVLPPVVIDTSGRSQHRATSAIRGYVFSA